MNRLIEAAEIAGFDSKNIDLDLLIGALVSMKRWAESESHLKALGKKSMCEGFRSEGQKLLAAAEAEAPEPEPELVLRVYRASSGQWVGVLMSGEGEIGRCGGCESPEDVQEAAMESGIIPDRVEIMEQPCL